VQDRTKWKDTVALRIHGDSARVHWISKLLILSWQSGVIQGASLDTRFVYTVVPCHDIFKDVTVDQEKQTNELSRTAHLCSRLAHAKRCADPIRSDRIRSENKNPGYFVRDASLVVF
jgi:hypothetical protein